MQNSIYAIEIKNLNKQFKETKALSDLSFSVKKGQLYGFLGLNGAGKSTTLNIILGLLKKDSGDVLINGLEVESNIDTIRKETGIVFQDSILDPTLSVYDNIFIRASLYKKYLKGQDIKQVVEEIIKEFQLDEIKKRPYGKLSGGQRRRVDIARALVHKPSILFLDEPTTGLDPSSRKLVWEVLAKIQKERKLTILLTTHYMEEANNCEYAIIIQKGKKIVEGTPADLKVKYATTVIKVYTHKNDLLDKILSHYDCDVKIDENAYNITFIGYNKALECIRHISKHFDDFEFIKGTMDEVFLNVTNIKKKELEEQNA